MAQGLIDLYFCRLFPGMLYVWIGRVTRLVLPSWIMGYMQGQDGYEKCNERLLQRVLLPGAGDVCNAGFTIAW